MSYDKKILKEVFDLNPKVDTLHQTPDGNVFFASNMAFNHDPKFITVTREQLAEPDDAADLGKEEKPDLLSTDIVEKKPEAQSFEDTTQETDPEKEEKPDLSSTDVVEEKPEAQSFEDTTQKVGESVQEQSIEQPSNVSEDQNPVKPPKKR